MKLSVSLLSCLLICLLSMGLNAQEDLSYLPEGLHKLRQEEIKETPLVISKLPHFLDGKKISPRQIYNLLIDPAYSSDLYGDKNGKIKAVVIRKSTEEERKAKMATSMGPKNPVDWKGREAPHFEAVDLNGEAVNLDDLKGKVVVVNFWFIGCKPCIKEMPELNRLVKKFRNEEVVFLAFGLDNADKMNAFLTENAFDYQIIPRARPFTNRFGVTGYPTHFIINQEGVVQYSQRGYFAGVVPTMRGKISELLKN